MRQRKSEMSFGFPLSKVATRSSAAAKGVAHLDNC